MQQTQNYKLNLIETSDTFSPNPLNENADTLDAVLARMDGAAAGLDQRVQVLELRHFTVGTYIGNAQETQFIELGFTPQAVFVYKKNNDNFALAVTGSPAATQFNSVNRISISILENGFSGTQASGFNANNSHYNYFAFG